jgi:hypothetical protein
MSEKVNVYLVRRDYHRNGGRFFITSEGETFRDKNPVGVKEDIHYGFTITLKETELSFGYQYKVPHLDRKEISDPLEVFCPLYVKYNNEVNIGWIENGLIVDNGKEDVKNSVRKIVHIGIEEFKKKLEVINKRENKNIALPNDIGEKTIWIMDEATSEGIKYTIVDEKKEVHSGLNGLFGMYKRLSLLIDIGRKYLKKDLEMEMGKIKEYMGKIFLYEMRQLRGCLNNVGSIL